MSQGEGSVEISLLSDNEGTDVPSPKRPREDKKYGGAYAYNQSFKQYGRRDGHV